MAVGVGTAVGRSGKVGVGVSTIITGPRVGVGTTVAVSPGTGVTVDPISGEAAGDLTGANDGGGVDPVETIAVAPVSSPAQANAVDITTTATTTSDIFPRNSL